MQCKIALAAVFLAVCINTGAIAKNLISDGGFEKPVVGNGSEVGFNFGQNIGAWSVVGYLTGDPTQVSLVNRSYQKVGFTFNAHSGQQSLNLTNGDDGQHGVVQTVQTTAGTTYRLSFWAGTAYDPNNIFTSMGKVEAYVNGILLATAIVVGVPNTTTVNWQKFEVTFTATSDHSQIMLVDGTILAGEVGLDDVELQAQ